MKNYDVIIVGAGIAGTSLAYNLSKECPEKKVLLIDKCEPGANACYGYRNTTKDAVKEYNLPYEHVYKGIKVGTGNKVYFILNKKYYFLNYKKVCKNFMDKSNIEFSNENAIDISGKILKTDKSEYKFEIFIDCTGHNFFAKKIFRQKIPFRYWIGKTRVLKNTLKEKEYFYHQFTDTNYFEDINPLGDRTLQGDWFFVKKIDFNLIKNVPNDTIYKKNLYNSEIIAEYNSVIPCSPTVPLVYKNLAFLGDSFGNPTTSSACGIKVILDTSVMLAEAIKKNDLKSYEYNWKKKNLDNYIKYLVVKYDSYHNSKFLEYIKKNPSRINLLPILKKYPEAFEKMMNCDPNISFPEEMKKCYPKRSKLFKAIYYFYLKSKYAIM